MQTQTAKSHAQAGTSNKGVRILAKSIFRELTAQGYSERQIVNLASELISEVTSNMASSKSPKG